MNFKLKLSRVLYVLTLCCGLMLGGTGLAWAATVIGTSITFDNGAGLQTSTTTGNTALLRAYDVDGTAYTTFATLTAGNSPTMDLNENVTIGGVSMYRVGGTDVAVADGGTGASSAANARTNLGLAIGTNVQAWSANLDSWSAVNPASMATLTGVEALTNKTVNGLTFTPEADGFSIGGGVIARTLTVTGGRLTLQLNGSEPMATFMLPNSGQLVTRNSSDMLTNKSVNGLGLATTVGGFSITNNALVRAFSIAGAQNVTLTATGATDVTLPTSGTLATLTGVEDLTNKTINGMSFVVGDDQFTLAGDTTRLTVVGSGTAADDHLQFLLPTGGMNLIVQGGSSPQYLVTRTSSDILENKTINVDFNTLTNINANELDPITGNNYGLPIIWKATVTDGSDEVFTASAPFKFRLLDAWAISTSTDFGGGWWDIRKFAGGIGTVCSQNTDVSVAASGHFYRASFIDNNCTVLPGNSLVLNMPGDAFDGEVYVMLMRVD